jgi:hypothetical protein
MGSSSRSDAMLVASMRHDFAANDTNQTCAEEQKAKGFPLTPRLRSQELLVIVQLGDEDCGGLLLSRFDLRGESLDRDLATSDHECIRGEYDVRGRAVRVPHEVNDIVQNVQGVHCELVSPGLEQRGENPFEEPANRLPAFKRAIRTDDDGVVCVIAEDAVEVASAKSAEMVFEDLPSGARFSCHSSLPNTQFKTKRHYPTRSSAVRVKQ